MYAISPAPNRPKSTNSNRTTPVDSPNRLASPEQTPAIHLSFCGRTNAEDAMSQGYPTRRHLTHWDGETLGIRASRRSLWRLFVR